MAIQTSTRFQDISLAEFLRLKPQRPADQITDVETWSLPDGRLLLREIIGWGCPTIYGIAS